MKKCCEKNKRYLGLTKGSYVLYQCSKCKTYFSSADIEKGEVNK